jgi:chromosome segregation ATPase
MRKESQSLRQQVHDQLTKCEELEGRNESLNARLSETTKNTNTMKVEMKQKEADTKNLEREINGMMVETDRLKIIIDETERARGVIEREKDDLTSETNELKSDMETSQKEQKELADQTEERMKAKDTAIHQLDKKAKDDMASREKEVALVKSELEEMSVKYSGLQRSFTELKDGNHLMVRGIKRLMGGGRSLFQEMEDRLAISGRIHDQPDQYDTAQAQGELTPKSSMKRRRRVKTGSNSKRMKKNSVMSNNTLDDEALLRTPGESLTE